MMFSTSDFGCHVFNDQVMRERLPEDIYRSLRRTVAEGEPLNEDIAEVVAAAMKNWAMELGASHFTHWFHPMTNITAGKMDSFLEMGEDGRVIAQLSSKALIKGEPDASSFPSGGLRATFEARGYTAWDPTSAAFVRDGVLYIPTAFCAYTGEALDTKTPLMRSMEVINRETLRLLRLLGNTTAHRVMPSVGAEQEYFLVDRERYEARLDLKLCGRTVLGARPPKAQELDDHYCGRIRIRVADFMQEVDRQLWHLGVPAKTRHNETAPAQHELAVIYTTVNVAADQNQLIMEVLRTTAKRKGLACLLHEKPFDGINGSGKHNNYSLSTDDGLNLFKPGKDPKHNKVFLLALCGMLYMVDTYADLLRMSASCPGNDHRLGGYEAPPPIISMFLGEHLTQVLEDVANGTLHESLAGGVMNTGVSSLPQLYRDDSDRNRTSPMAFTGNKFEFRMVGSSQPISLCNMVMNTALAEAFASYSDRLEGCGGDLDGCISAIVADTLASHGRVLFNGNNYTQEWVEEAGRRGLPVITSSVDAYKAIVAPKNVELFRRFGVFTPTECSARFEIMLENYVKTTAIESATMAEMVRRQILPALTAYAGEVAHACHQMAKATGHSSASTQDHLDRLMKLLDSISRGVDQLDAVAGEISRQGDEQAQAEFARDQVCAAMAKLRRCCDEAETITDARRWPLPTYTDLLHRV